MRRLTFSFVLLLPALMVSHAGVIPQAPPPADLVLTNGTVITVDTKDTIMEALAVTGGKIVFVGKSADAKKYICRDGRLRPAL
jgi:adenine deaminase